MLLQLITGADYQHKNYLNLQTMTTRTFVDKNGNSWEWEETPETIEALKQLHESVKKVNEPQTTNS